MVSLVNDASASISYTGTSSSTTAYIEVPFTNNGSVSVGKGVFYISTPASLDLRHRLLLDSGRRDGSAGYGSRAFSPSVSVTGAETLFVNSSLMVHGTGVTTALTVGGTLTLPTGASLSTPLLTINSGTIIGPGMLSLRRGKRYHQ